MMSVAVRLGAVVALALVASGCCLPVPRTVTIQPEGEVRVSSGGAMVEGARVWLVREEAAPHPREGALERWTREADAAGVARFKLEERREWSFPLMMHGVMFYKWRICVEAAGMAEKIVEWRGGERLEVMVELEAGEPGAGCEAALPMAAKER